MSKMNIFIVSFLYRCLQLAVDLFSSFQFLHSKRDEICNPEKNGLCPGYLISFDLIHFKNDTICKI